MELSKEEYQRIFRKYLAGDARPEEVHLVETYYKTFDLEKDFTDALSARQRRRLELRMKQRIDATCGKQQKTTKMRSVTFWMRYLGAAMLCLVVSIAIYFYFGKSGSVKQRSSIVDNQAAIPQPLSPTLKLSDGAVLNLDSLMKDAVTRTIDGIVIARSDDGSLTYHAQQERVGTNRYHEMNTPKGKQMGVVLPDGTKVLLNAASTLRFPAAFAQHERKVVLIGEAYFDVAKDKNRPFFVQSKESEIRVTGTEFNVTAYPDEKSVKTTLIAGGVDVYFNHERLQLQPGEEVISNVDGVSMKKRTVDMDVALAWKDGYFVFDQPLDQVMRMLERWYDVEIRMDQDVSKIEVAGRFSRSRDFRQILSYLADFGGFRYTAEGNKVFITKNKLK